MRLEMITPIRGRKLSGFSANILCSFLIRNDNPDKGTETSVKHTCCVMSKVIRNDNPDKGTETGKSISHPSPVSGLEMITPIRGRKL